MSVCRFNPAFVAPQSSESGESEDYLIVLNEKHCMSKGMKKINLQEKYSLFAKFWSPKIIAELNGQHVKIAKLKGEFEWHHHDHADELFWVTKGVLLIHLRDETVELTAGEMFVVPRGVDHKPEAPEEVNVVLFEPAGTLNTGEIKSSKTVTNPEFI
jgi:mannose-6-phosphate isomerase-like protein (cupin superfamily)